MTARSYWPILEKIIATIPPRPYDSARAHTGVTRDLYAQGQILLRADRGGGSYCSGAVFEALWGLLESMGRAMDISLADAITLQQRVYERLDLLYERGGVGAGLVDLGLGLKVADPMLAQPGDFAQIWDRDVESGEWVWGHSVVVAGHTENKSGAPALTTWSSAPDTGGHGEDYFSVRHPRTGRERIWWVATLK